MTALDTADAPPASHRDRAILAAVAAGRCVAVGSSLHIDGCPCADQFAAARLRAAGWLVLTGAVRPGTAGSARLVLAELTPAGRAQLASERE